MHRIRVSSLSDSDSNSKASKRVAASSATTAGATGRAMEELGADPSAHLSASIPVIDFRLLANADGHCNQDEVAKLKAALSSWGFFQLTGHGPTSFLGEVRGLGRRFFDLPMQEKKRYACKGEGFAEGYGEDQTGNHVGLTDRMLLFVEPPDLRKLDFWPENPSNFRATLHEYSTMSKAIVRRILEAVAKALDLEDTHFITHLEGGMSVMCRFSRYPPHSSPDPDRPSDQAQQLGLVPHSDNTVVTLFLQGDSVEGLEVLKDDVWFKVPNNPDVLLVLVGDLLEIMSNGRFKSPVHRVVSHPDGTRFSTTLFYILDPEMEIGPAKGLLIEQGEPRMYRDIKLKDYQAVHLKGFSEGRKSIDWAKLQ